MRKYDTPLVMYTKVSVNTVMGVFNGINSDMENTFFGLHFSVC